MTSEESLETKYFTIGQDYFGEGQWGDAADYFRKVLEVNPDHPMVPILLGKSLIELNKIDEAIAVLEPAYEKDKKSGKILFSEGLVLKAKSLARERRDQEALAYCERALEVSPNNGPAFQVRMSIWMRRADHALLMDNLEGAAEAYRVAGDAKKAVQIKTLHRWQKQSELEARATSLEIEERWEEAIAHYEELLHIAEEKDIKESWSLAIDRIREEIELAKIFDNSLHAIRARDWTSARQQLIGILNVRQDYRRKRILASELFDRAVKANHAQFTENIPTRSPILLHPTQIGLRNIRRMVRLARWGAGRVGTALYSRDGQQIFINTTIGVAVMNSGDGEPSRWIDTDIRVAALGLSSDGKTLATGFADGLIWLWRAEDGALQAKLRGHAKGILGLRFSPDGRLLASAAEDGLVRLWDISEGKFFRLVDGGYETIRDLQFSGDGSALFILGKSSQLHMHTIESGEETRTLELGSSGYKLDISPDGNFIAVGLEGGAVSVFDLQSHSEQTKLTGHSVLITAMDFSPQKHRLAVGTITGEIKVWNWDDGELLHTISGHAGWVSSLQFSPDGAHLLSAGMDNNVIVWNLVEGSPHQVLDSFSGPIAGVIFAPDSQRLYAGMQTGHIDSWDISAGKRFYSNPQDGHRINSIALDPNGELLAASELDRIVISSAQDGVAIKVMDGLAGAPTVVCFSQNGSSLAAGFQNGMIALYSTTNWEPIIVFQGHSDRVNDLSFSPDGRHLASTSRDGSVVLWASDNFERFQTFAELSRDITKVIFSPDGSTLSCSTIDGVIWQWQATQDYAFHAQIQQDETAIDCLAYNLDGSILAAGLANGAILILEASTDRLLHTLFGHDGEISGLSFSSDGTLLASSGKDGILRIWGVVG